MSETHERAKLWHTVPPELGFRIARIRKGLDPRGALPLARNGYGGAVQPTPVGEPRVAPGPPAQPAPPAAPPAPPALPVPPARVAGSVLAVTLGAVATVTRQRPLHARGRRFAARLRIDEPAPGLGIPLLDERGVHPCSVRVSRALGTPEGLPDVGGLALRVPGAGRRGRPADLLFASTGSGRVTRHVLRPTRHPAEGPQATLLPTRALGRSIVLMVRPTEGGRSPRCTPRDYELCVSVDGSPWRPVGLIHVGHQLADEGTRFDPVVDELEGTTAPPWVVAVREPAYRWARRLTTGRDQSR
jgi:hypothetical protein